MNQLAVTSTLPSTLAPDASVPAASPAPSSETQLRETLKRCSPATIEAACAFRQSGDLDLLPVIVCGVIARFVERERRVKLKQRPDDVHLIGDLGIDSLTMMEIVMLAEDVFPISINNDELRGLHTVGDVQRFIECKLRGVPPPAPAPCECSGGGSTASASVAEGNEARPVSVPAHVSN